MINNLNFLKMYSIYRTLGVVFLLTICAHFQGFSQSVTDTLNWTGGWCSLCDGPVGNYACEGSTDWNNGEKSFNDPLTGGDTAKQVSVRVYYNTFGLDSFAVQLNGINVGTFITSDTATACGSCLTSTVSRIEPAGFPGYIYGGTNTIKLIPYHVLIPGPSCVSSAIYTLNGPPVVVASILKSDAGVPLDLKVYPNPANMQFIVEMNVVDKMDLTIKLFNIQGQEIFSKKSKQSPGKYSETIGTEFLSSGIYTLLVAYPGGSIDKKIVVEK